MFGCRCWSCVVWWVFAYVFALCFGGSLPKLFGKNSLDVRFAVSGFVLSSFGFRRRRFVFVCFSFSRDNAQVVTGHPHTHLCLLFRFFCPAAFVVSPFLAVRPASWRFLRGAILGPARFWDSPGTHGA